MSTRKKEGKKKTSIAKQTAAGKISKETWEGCEGGGGWRGERNEKKRK